MIITNSKFEEIARPTDDINPKVKRNSKEWFLSWGKYIWSYSDKAGDTPYSKRESYYRLRSFGAGRQDPDQYKPRFQTGFDQDTPTYSGEHDTVKTRKEKRQGLMNIDWSIVSVFPKFRRILLGKFSTMEHVIGANALDKSSSLEKEDAKWKLYSENILQNFKTDAFKRRGMQYNKESYVPEDTQELELFQSMGGFKLKQELAMELMIQHNFDISQWDKEIKDEIYGDLIDLGLAVIRDDLDTNTDKTRIEYVDPAGFIIQRSKSPTCRDSEFAGVIKKYMVSELRQKGFSEDELQAIAEAHGFGGVDNDVISSSVDLNDEFASHPYDDVKVAVLCFEVISTDTFYDVDHKNKYGVVRTYEEDENKYGTIRNTDTKKTNVSRINNVYEGKWIIDTDKVFEYDIKSGHPKDKGEVRLSYKVVKLPGQSMVESCITHLNEIQIDMLKIQSAKANASPNGMAINIDSISNMTLGGKSMSPLTIMEIRRVTGNLLYKMTPYGISGFGNNQGKPIEELKGGLGELVVELWNDVDNRLKMIREVTGINQISDASDPNPNASVRGSELALVATNNAIRPLYKGYMTLKENIALSACIRSQILIKNNSASYEAYYPVFGGHNLKILSIGEKISRTNYVIKVEAVPTEKQKADLDQYITIAMQAGKNGVPLIRASHGLMLKEMLMANVPLKSVRIMIAFLENKEMQIQHQMEIERMEAQGDEKRKSDEAAFGIFKQTEQIKTQSQIKIDASKSANKIQEIRAEKIFEATILMPAEEQMEKAIDLAESYLLRAEQREKIRFEARYSKEFQNVN